jgi:hypothetical protein
MNNKKSKNSAISAFLKGFASAFDITGGVETPDPNDGFRKDTEAIRGDWQRVGDDMRRAMNIVANEQ